ncbi:hypothetical protein G8S49_05545 [Clostridium botulinum C]|uniref:Uncharacterized protein n=2 Tax=Clostridium botulinum TaxID=1491 RepID=A0A9Q4Y0V3_CLOBO|nr:hypothetical protein [Clostridium botulinum]YP_398481.1 hypothetical protein CST051 [Clostridium phage c-st]MCD3194904.1 hypothetical protein [Clostridium botulinum C]MCD3200161.1 hypothetical protein [Clostridium botulinum C]MCD3205772.1 hypothetical protein [Clostridium botulinum C]MCD3207393.1 hypothetical protein [Clostridium botulinum C]MCD3226127.1 hypothetical protein [Clostridium botulinum C]
MCKFCKEGYEIDTMVGEREVIIKIDEEQKDFIKVRVPFVGGGAITKPIQINYCPFCGEILK